MKKKRAYKYNLIQDGMIVASVECEDKELAIKEIKHYAMMYSEDGPVKIEAK
jgi:hypothetical protein